MGMEDKLPIKEAYQDALSPAMKQIGGMLESGFKAGRFIWAPLDFIAAYQDRFQRYLKRISEKVPEDKLVEGHPQVVVPIVEGLIMSYEGSLLSEMFLNLLTNAVSSDGQNLAHPAFPLIINQLSHDEAKILYFLKKTTYINRERSVINYEKDEWFSPEKLDDIFPYQELMYPKQFDEYFYHLKGLSLVIEPKIENSTFEYDDKGKQTGVIELFEKRLTNFGELFAKACIPDSFD